MKTALCLAALAAPAMSKSFGDYEEDCWSAQPYCTMPKINHAVVLFGDDDPTKNTYSTDAHTLGNQGHMQGIAVKGKTRMGRNGMTIDVHGKGTDWRRKSVVTGPLVGTGNPNFKAGLLTEVQQFNSRYDQAEWIQFAKDLKNAASRGDATIQHRVRFYEPATTNGLSIMRDDSPDEPEPSVQVMHVVLGKGRFRADNDDNNKVDGIIIAPEADVQIHRRWQHADGFIVAKTLREWWEGKNGADSGLQIHGQNATGIKCSVPRPEIEDCCVGTDCDDGGCREEEIIDWCAMPPLEHALVMFGECDKNPLSTDKRALNTDSHTYGQQDGVEGVAVCGNVRMGVTNQVSIAGTSIITGSIEEWTPTPDSMARINNDRENATAAFNALYNQDEWIRFANDLYTSYKKGDHLLGNRVVFYELTEDENVLRAVNGSRTDEPLPGDAKIHVVLGRGTFKLNLPNKQYSNVPEMEANRKFSGSIIAPEANVRIDDTIGFIDGFVVARRLTEWWNGKNGANSGLQIHGTVPTGITCECTPVASDCDTVGRQCVMPPPGSDEFDATEDGQDEVITTPPTTPPGPATPPPQIASPGDK